MPALLDSHQYSHSSQDYKYSYSMAEAFAWSIYSQKDKKVLVSL